MSAPNMLIWEKFNEFFGTPRVIWAEDECETGPTVTDRILYQIIFYYDQPSTARKAVRIFLGIDEVDGCLQYSGWEEVRVATIREIYDTLILAGCTANTWELAVTIKDFLQNAVDTLDTIELNNIQEELKPTEFLAYLRQLRGIPDAWKKGETSPFRPNTDFVTHCKKYRVNHEMLLPESIIQYIEYLFGRTSHAPFEYHANRLFARLGYFNDQDESSIKITKFNEIIGEEKPINKHRHLVQFSKTICISTPRCHICPLSLDCETQQKNSSNNLTNLQQKEISP